ncbi:MAG: hypothetical protein A2806_02035 [Candidatus Terrybacteria bacterium RIFCSPHIGHO2_01_FULL_48_17]|uniref:CMP/dCMP-type deaminase domain-containing protein n=1 Tax=Candidatus Terrybacteria bacterium RIFCSPHIGHO2_01_FULL_48_17 TaxID=1802362 RepID=A0A1G2PLF8_9BACT|nr:MAG: hypothetical protein A2806_02035 [Candidatus Terrybacteria bacterium RIFCSPHIGHO2_01_FULL_48_17]OHA52622.1 MAG: hypothetical protein A3A30_03260 [Candidatus Terrybacteria bacterium RIFCSPLOWO2_01_FULL_48_14]
MNETSLPRDAVFMKQAEAESRRATCPRAHVGFLLERHGKLLIRSSNQSPEGLPTCKEAGHLMVDGHCARVTHSERGGFVKLALKRLSPQGATAYTTWFPCVDCMNLIILGKIKRLVFASMADPNSNYRREFHIAKRFALRAGVKLIHFPKEKLLRA